MSDEFFPFLRYEPNEKIYIDIRTIVVFCNTRTKTKNTGTQERPKHYEILKS